MYVAVVCTQYRPVVVVSTVAHSTQISTMSVHPVSIPHCMYIHVHIHVKHVHTYMYMYTHMWYVYTVRFYFRFSSGAEPYFFLWCPTLVALYFHTIKLCHCPEVFHRPILVYTTNETINPMMSTLILWNHPQRDLNG